MSAPHWTISPVSGDGDGPAPGRHREYTVAAIDPIRSVSRDVHDVTFTVKLTRELHRLAALPPSTEAPYVTVSLDFEPDGTSPNRRPAIEQVERELDTITPPDSDRSVAGESLRADRERILATLAELADSGAAGIVIVANDANDVYEVVPLGLAVPTEVTMGPVPSLMALARFAEDNSLYAVLLFDQQEAHLTTIAQGRRRRSLRVRGNDYPRKQQAGGLSQRRFQSRADERIEHFVRGVAEETQKELEARQIGSLVLAGDEQIVAAMRKELHQTVLDLVVDDVRLDIRASDEDIVEATAPIVEQTERHREMQAVEDVRDGIGQGSKAVGGSIDVLRALEAGQAMKLVLNDDYTESGWADYGMLTFGIGDIPKEHPAGGNVADIVPVELEQELVRMALQTGAEVEVVLSDVPISDEEQTQIRDPEESAFPRAEAAMALDALGGIGATLRFAIGDGDSDSPVVEA